MKITTKIVTRSDNLSEIVRILSKEVKQEEDNLYRVLLCGLSAFTAEPINIRIFAPSSEGKTYLLEKVSNIFPPENVIKLASASPTSFKYENGETVIEEKGKFVPINTKLEEFKETLEKEIREKKTKETSEQSTETTQSKESFEPSKEEKDTTQEESEFTKEEEKEITEKMKEERKRLGKKAVNLIDLENKWLIFLDDQNPGLWDFFKPVLSQDTLYTRHNTTNNQSGANWNQKTVFKDHPSFSYASAKDESKIDLTSEISSRFQTISLQSNPKKYKESLELIACKYGYPGQVYEDTVISKEDITHAKSLVSSIIQTLKKHKKIEGPTCNPFANKINELFPKDTGSRSRQLKRLMNTINLFTLCNANQRPKLDLNGIIYPCVHINDVKHAVRLIRENSEIPEHKIQTYNEIIKPSILNHGQQKTVEGQKLVVQTASQILEQYQEHKRGYTRKQLLETYLLPLADSGFLEKTRDPDNKSRDIFWIPERYQEEDAAIESTLIDTSTLDESCVISGIEKQIIQRYKKEQYRFIDTNDTTISEKELAIQLMSIDTPPAEISFKN